MITKDTRLKIKGYLEGFIQGIVDEATKSEFDPKNSDRYARLPLRVN